jgi:hypothetical protein
VPFIGDVPGKDGQYVAAGYNGHGKYLKGLRLKIGMARIFLCAPTLANYILTDKWDPAMPDAFKITPERLDKLRAKIAPSKEATSQDDSTAEGTVHGTLIPALEDATI